MAKVITGPQAQLNLSVVALVALVAIVGLVALVLNSSAIGASVALEPSLESAGNVNLGGEAHSLPFNQDVNACDKCLNDNGGNQSKCIAACR